MSVGGIVACVRCRTPFHIQQERNGTSGTTTAGSNQCRKCTANTHKYGPPSACEHCGLQAAYTGTKCRRCFAAIVKWGPPVPCCRCARVCAFQRPDLSTGQTAASPLCFVCSLAKHRQTLITGKPFGNKPRPSATDSPVTSPLDNHINLQIKPVNGRIMDNYGSPHKQNDQVNNSSPENGDTVASDDSDVPMDF
ncbi:unnamed protein product, partial [Meganyctiphanes norvegica]